MEFDLGVIRWDADGLVPAIVQSTDDGRVLMLAWMDAEALDATRETGLVHFHSRSRGRLWQKGEISGNLLQLRDLALDCDGDALLVSAEAVGPTCHTGTRSCFGDDPEPPQQGLAWLETLWSTIRQRATDRPAGSYTSRLLDGGVDAVARKVAEESIEVVMAAKDDAAGSSDATRAALAGELADLVYHAMVLAAERDLPPAAVIEVLRSRWDARDREVRGRGRARGPSQTPGTDHSG